MLADKYRYRPPSSIPTRHSSLRPGTVEPINESAAIERTNPSMNLKSCLFQ